MNRSLALTIGFLVVLGATAYGQSFRATPDFQNPRSVAGEVSADGTIVKGTGFGVSRVSQGHYEIRFRPGIFPDSCPIVTASSVSSYPNPPLAAVYQRKPACGFSYQVLLSWAGTDSFADYPFTFVAVGTP